MDAGVLGKVDSFRVMRGYDTFDVETFCKETAFFNSGRAGASRRRNYFCQDSLIQSHQLFCQRCEESPDAVGCNDATCRRIPQLKPVPDVEFALLHIPHGFDTEFSATFPIVGEWSVHDDRVEIAQGKPDLRTCINVGSVQGFERT